MSFKNTPITAKIKRTTKGGITQPLLNVGAPIKMKMSSPAKKKYDGQSVKPGEDGLGTKTAAGDKSIDSMRAISSRAAKDFKNEMSRQDKVKADNLAASKAKKAAKDKSNYQKSVDQYRKDVSTLNANTKAASKNVNPKQMSSAMNRSVRQAGRIKAFEKNLYDYDTKNKIKQVVLKVIQLKSMQWLKLVVLISLELRKKILLNQILLKIKKFHTILLIKIEI